MGLELLFFGIIFPSIQRAPQENQNYNPVTNYREIREISSRNTTWAIAGENMTRLSISCHTDLVSRQSLRYRMLHLLDLRCNIFGGLERSVAPARMGRIEAELNNFSSQIFGKNPTGRALSNIWSTQSPRGRFLPRPSNFCVRQITSIVLYHRLYDTEGFVSICTLHGEKLAIVCCVSLHLHIGFSDLRETEFQGVWTESLEKLSSPRNVII